ncbi:MAG: helix-hairpin-helix domain-containing protein [Planctomycetota bacterium]
MNAADVARLRLLPEIGPGRAARIVEHRQTHGAFASPADLEAVPGIGPAIRAAVEPWVVTKPPEQATE